MNSPQYKEIYVLRCLDLEGARAKLLCYTGATEHLEAVSHRLKF